MLPATMKADGQVYTPYSCKAFEIKTDGAAETEIEHIVALGEAHESDPLEPGDSWSRPPRAVLVGKYGRERRTRWRYQPGDSMPSTVQTRPPTTKLHGGSVAPVEALLDEDLWCDRGGRPAWLERLDRDPTSVAELQTALLPVVPLNSAARRCNRCWSTRVVYALHG